MEQFADLHQFVIAQMEGIRCLEKYAMDRDLLISEFKVFEIVFDFVKGNLIIRDVLIKRAEAARVVRTPLRYLQELCMISPFPGRRVYGTRETRAKGKCSWL